MAQHAKPNVAGNIDFWRAHFTSDSSVPVMMLWSSPSRPWSNGISDPYPSGGVLTAAFEAHPLDGRRRRALRRHHRRVGEAPHALHRTPVERAVGDEVQERDEHGRREQHHLPQPERTEAPEL